ncbi:MAG: tetratricopeptide repeat protein, partial [Anaerolineae bacterium]|nr:tetratricopeptide repeat protein [Anaerolineae bacterium]
ALSLLTQGITANIQGERTASETLLLDSLDMYRALCDRAGQVDVLLGLGANVIGHRDFIRARGYLEAALALCRELGHLAGIAQCLQGLGSLALRHGDLMLAEQWLNQSTAALRVITAQDISSSSELLGELAYWQGNYTEARARFQESLRLS